MKSCIPLLWTIRPCSLLIKYILLSRVRCDCWDGYTGESCQNIPCNNCQQVTTLGFRLFQAEFAIYIFFIYKIFLILRFLFTQQQLSTGNNMMLFFHCWISRASIRFFLAFFDKPNFQNRYKILNFKLNCTESVLQTEIIFTELFRGCVLLRVHADVSLDGLGRIVLKVYCKLKSYVLKA